VRDTVLCICELGWLYNRVAGYLKSSFAVSTDSNGVVVQAFGFALQVYICVTHLSGLCVLIIQTFKFRFYCTFSTSLLLTPYLQ